MYRPRPVPGILDSRTFQARWKGSSTRPRSSSGTPTPSSSTVAHSQPSLTDAPIVTGDPAGAYFNALKYAPAGSPVTIGASVSDGWLWATVDDEGVGVPEEERGLVLEPFHRAWNVRESRIPGTGLGLYICRRLVEAHGGRLSLAERPNGASGTRVSFSMPILAGARRQAAGTRRHRSDGPADG